MPKHSDRYNEMANLGAQMRYNAIRAELSDLLREFPILQTVTARNKRLAMAGTNGNGHAAKRNMEGVGRRVRAMMEKRGSKTRRTSRKITQAPPPSNGGDGKVIFLKDWLVGDAVLHLLTTFGPMPAAEIIQKLTAHHFTNTKSKNLSGLVAPTMTHLLKKKRVKRSERGGVVFWTPTKTGEGLAAANLAPKVSGKKSGKRGKKGNEGVGIPDAAPLHLPSRARHAALGDTAAQA